MINRELEIAKVLAPYPQWKWTMVIPPTSRNPDGATGVSVQ